MILADSSVWIDHFRRSGPALADALHASAVVSHPFVIGEIACGRLLDRGTTLGLLRRLPSAPVATHGETLAFIEARELGGRAIGYVDAHLLASLALAGETTLWTRDRRLAELAAALGMGSA
jgi:predicted nucleic acid-binding protein